MRIRYPLRVLPERKSLLLQREQLRYSTEFVVPVRFFLTGVLTKD